MSILDDAAQLVQGSRNEAYGHPLQDFQRVAVIWSGILNVLVTPEQVGLCLAGLKLAREAYQHKRDHLIDLAGYADCLQQIADTKELPPWPTSAPSAAPPPSPSAYTSSAPTATVSPTPAARAAQETCPTCQRFLPHPSSQIVHQCA